ncbi:MAG TPA: hypothetical protein VLS89_03220, partial [Candidatus Nanopelagicales bacterium]|nr:hypothetical protein [Candidatus Nanopelagicales bacterium]
QGTLILKANDGYSPYSYTILERFASFEDIVAGAIAETLPLSVYNTRMTSAEGVIYSAWHATNTVDLQSLTTYESLPSIPLEGFDDWVHGLWAHPATQQLVLLSAHSEDRLLRFDISTGEQLSSVPVQYENYALRGLHCWVQ